MDYTRLWNYVQNTVSNRFEFSVFPSNTMTNGTRLWNLRSIDRTLLVTIFAVCFFFDYFINYFLRPSSDSRSELTAGAARRPVLSEIELATDTNPRLRLNSNG